ncbi:MAG: sigma-70 family RNA polymerase sigma factor [Candidatus Microbacterium colombiense]|nr:MAG: sigma-70 family RNA polymerase sigma factor [Microbacterium sp.]
MSARSEARDADREAAFKKIYDTFWAPIRRHVECVVDDEHEVSEIVSDVFLLAWKKLDPSRPLGLIWLLRAADNKLKDRERSRRARERAWEAVHTVYAAPSEESLLDSLAVRHAIDTVLTPRERQIVMLSYWDQLAAGEVAQVLRCSQASVWTTLSRARKKLETELGLDQVDDEPDALGTTSAAESDPRSAG